MYGAVLSVIQAVFTSFTVSNLFLAFLFVRCCFVLLRECRLFILARCGQHITYYNVHILFERKYQTLAHVWVY